MLVIKLLKQLKQLKCQNIHQKVGFNSIYFTIMPFNINNIQQTDNEITILSHKKIYHGTLPMYHGTLSMYHGILVIYHGTLLMVHFSYMYLFERFRSIGQSG